MKKQWMILMPNSHPLWDEKKEMPKLFGSLKAAKAAAADASIDEAGGYFRIFEAVAFAVMPITRSEIRPIGR